MTTQERLKEIDWTTAQRMVSSRRTSGRELARLLGVSNGAVLKRITPAPPLESTRRRPRSRSPHRPEPTTRARVRYEEAYGVILSEDMLVHHLDWDSTNDDVDNLMALTHEEHAFVHSSAFFRALRRLLRRGRGLREGTFWDDLKSLVIDVLWEGLHSCEEE